MFLHFFQDSKKLAQIKQFGSNVSSFSLYQYHLMGRGVEKGRWKGVGGGGGGGTEQ